MKVIAIIALLFCGTLAQEGPQCQSPNGGGLTPVIREFIDMIPIEEILDIVLYHITNDPETQAVMEYLSSPDFHQIIIMVQNQPAFNSLVSFACSDLYIDAKYYLNYLAGIFGFPEIRSISSRHSGGFHEMLLEVLEVIPTEAMKVLLEQKLASDYYVQLAFQKINSDEFGMIIEALQSNAAYNDMKDRLRSYDVDVDLIIDSLGKIFRP